MTYMMCLVEEKIDNDFFIKNKMKIKKMRQVISFNFYFFLFILFAIQISNSSHIFYLN